MKKKIKIVLMFIGYTNAIASGILLSIYSLFNITYFIDQSIVFFGGVIIAVIGIRFFLDFNDEYFKNPDGVV